MKQIIILLSFVLFFISANAQDYPYSKYDYGYIRYDKNNIQFPGDSLSFERFFSKIDRLILRGEGKVNIIHFGGSHIQAGIYSGRARERFQTMYPGLNGGRGLIFPYRMSRTNNPNNYNITWTGSWTTCRNVQHKTCKLGLLGIVAKTCDENARLKIVSGKNYIHYDINRIRVFHDTGATSYDVVLNSDTVPFELTKYPDKGYTLIETEQYLDTIELKLIKTDSLQTEFRLYGIDIENDDSGIVYHDSGINGASIPSYLKCDLLVSQMADIEPDLVIISLGTNDTYTRNFNPEFYRQNYIKLIKNIREAAPDAAVLMTVPNDCYFHKRYPNKNTAAAEKVIFEVAQRYNCGVWDFYEIMGGFNASALWYQDLLMNYDRIHFSPTGYLIKGDLFFEAVLKSYDNHIETIKKALPEDL